jgi:hypothetical protein
MQLPAHCDLLIVGAGPTGRALKSTCTTISMQSSSIVTPCARNRAQVQARTMEIYAQQLAERALELGKRAAGANLWARGRRTARVPSAMTAGRGFSISADPGPG